MQINKKVNKSITIQNGKVVLNSKTNSKTNSNTGSIIPNLFKSVECRNIIGKVLPKLIDLEEDLNNQNFDIANVDLIITRTNGKYTVKVNNHRLEKLQKIFND